MKKILLVLLALLAGALGAPAQTVDDLYEAGAAWVEDNVPDEVLQLLEPPTEEDLNAFWRSVEDALHSQSLDDLTWILPYARAAAEYLRSFPEGEPYADWLDQRIDYFDMADDAVSLIPAAPAAPPARRPAGKVTRLAPAPRSKRAAPPAPVNQRRLAAVRSPKSWKQKLASRPPPADATALVPRLKEIFRKEGVPPEWVWLAEVESSMNPKAKSPVGAAGLYQFMPGTARSLGLKTSPRDERLVPEKSASAAARYLKYLHKRFNSWPLALAAYNAGEGNVGKALGKTSDKTFEGIQDFLPLETQMYVPKVMATVSLREGVDASTLPPPTAWLNRIDGMCLAAWVLAD